MNWKKITFVLFLVTIIALPIVLAAEGDAEQAKAEIKEYVNTTLVNGFRFFGGIIAVIAVGFGAFNFITAAGDPDKIRKGVKCIVGAIVGVIILAFAPQIVAIFTPT